MTFVRLYDSMLVRVCPNSIELVIKLYLELFVCLNESQPYATDLTFNYFLYVQY